MTRCRACLVIAACLLIGVVCPSCMISASPPSVLEERATTETERILTYYTSLRGLSAEALQRERLQQESAFVRSRSHEDRLRLVAVLSVSDVTAADLTYGLTLLHEYLHDQEVPPTSVQAMAMLFWHVLHSKERSLVYAELYQKLQDSLLQQEKHLAMQQQMNQKLQEEVSHQKLLNISLQRQLQDAVNEKERQNILQRQLTNKLQDEKRNVRKLQEKIEKIQDIERSLMDRERTDNKGT